MNELIMGTGAVIRGFPLVDGNEIDGKEIADSIIGYLKDIIDRMGLASSGFRNHMNLVIVTTGTDDASKVYVRSKARRCEELGIECTEIHYDYFDYSACQNFIKKLKALNYPPFIIQLPMRGDYNRKLIYEDLYQYMETDGIEDPDGLISRMDVDGLIAKDNILFTYTPQYMIDTDTHNLIDPYCLPCTPAGIMTLILSVTSLYRKNVVILGRSDLVGKPLEAMIRDQNATVTVLHSYSSFENFRKAISNCDILISAMGSTTLLNEPNLEDIDLSNIVLIDAGMNRVNGKLRGDCDPNLLPKFGACTPVPGGVGPMTVASLMVNVVKYYQTPNMSIYAGALLPAYPSERSNMCHKEYYKDFYEYKIEKSL